MFYIKSNEQIVLVDEVKQNIINSLEFMPQYKDLPILETAPNEVIVDFKLMTIEEAKALEDKEEAERIAKLTCTKRVLALALQEYGLTYAKLKELIATNEQAQLEWDLCVELERSNPLLDTMGAELGITPIQLDNIFRLANGEEIVNDNSTDKQSDINADEVQSEDTV